jgi:hypothetical protein
MVYQLVRRWSLSRDKALLFFTDKGIWKLVVAALFPLLSLTFPYFALLSFFLKDKSAI